MLIVMSYILLIYYSKPVIVLGLGCVDMISVSIVSCLLILGTAYGNNSSQLLRNMKYHPLVSHSELELRLWSALHPIRIWIGNFFYIEHRELLLEVLGDVVVNNVINLLLTFPPS